MTSREPLHTTGEVLLRLGPLAVDGSDSPACRLFRDRVPLAGVDVALEEDDVREVCRRVDGLPLAIELAASRLRSMSIGDVAAGLDDRLSAIRGEMPRGTSAHRTLHGVVSWSIDNLTEPDRALLRRLSVFAGGCTAAAAATVCGIAGDPVEALATLVDRSLVQAEHRRPEPAISPAGDAAGRRADEAARTRRARPVQRTAPGLVPRAGA